MIGIVITIGAETRRALIRSHLAQSSPLGMELHVAAVEPRRRYRQGFAEMVEVEASPEAWEWFHQWTLGECGQPHGINEGERKDSRMLWKVGQKVFDELDRLAKHPAYNGKAVLGVSNVTLPAYRSDGTYEPTRWRIVRERTYEGTEVEEGELVPRLIKVRGRRFTTWDWVSSAPADEPASEQTSPA